MAQFNEHGACIDYGVPIKVEKSMSHILVRTAKHGELWGASMQMHLGLYGHYFPIVLSDFKHATEIDAIKAAWASVRTQAMKENAQLTRQFDTRIGELVNKSNSLF